MHCFLVHIACIDPIQFDCIDAIVLHQYNHNHIACIDPIQLFLNKTLFLISFVSFINKALTELLDFLMAKSFKIPSLVRLCSDGALYSAGHSCSVVFKETSRVHSALILNLQTLHGLCA